MTALLGLRDLAADIGGVEVLSAVTFDVAPGQCLGVVGETGSGKSLTCQVITGTLARSGGSVSRGSAVFDGVDLTRLPERGWRELRGRRIALVPQGSMSGLDPVRTVWAQLKQAIGVLEGVRGRAARRARAADLLRQVGLDDTDRVLGSYAHQLSGGMRQRVMIALALVGSPALLVADEPTTALDVTVQDGILRLLDELRRRRGLAVVLVTHDLGVVEQFSDRVAVLYGGMTVETGPTATVLAEPRHPYTRALLAARLSAARPGLPVEGIPGGPPSPAAPPPGCRFAPRCPLATAECDAARPPLEPVGADHLAACLRKEESPDE